MNLLLVSAEPIKNDLITTKTEKTAISVKTMQGTLARHARFHLKAQDFHLYSVHMT